MVDASLVLSHAWAILLFSLFVTAIIFPLVFIMAFAYEWLQKNHRKAPKIVLMLLVTFLAVLVAVTLIEVYLEYTLPKVISTALG